MNNHLSRNLIFFVFFLITPVTAVADTVIDGVVASVDGEPITLLELSKRMKPPRPMSLQEAAADAEARQVLDDMILDRLVEAEAAARRISVADGELQALVEDVARRNDLSLEQFSEALRDEGSSLDGFKRKVKGELLRQKLAANLAAGGLAISDEEIEAYIKEHPQLAGRGQQVQLGQIFVATQGKSEQAAALKIGEARDALKGGGEFAVVARKYSESSEASEGGGLGSLAVSDLSPMIFNAIQPLKPGEYSEVVQSPMGFHIFSLLQRDEPETDRSEQLKDDAREFLKKQKLEGKLKDYFTSDLYKQHAVDKKI